MTGPWTARQIHDTVAAIARGPSFAAAPRESLFGRFLRLVFHEIGRLLDAVRGSADSRIILGAAVVLAVFTIVARVAADRRSADLGRRGHAGRGERGARRERWRVAAELADAERFAEASHELYAAVIETLAGAGVIRFHASKTNGDYARELRRAGWPAAEAFRAFGRDFDRTVFAGGDPSRDDFERLRAAAERLVGDARGRAAA